MYWQHSPGFTDELESPEDGSPGGLVGSREVNSLQSLSLVRQQQLGLHQAVQIWEPVLHLQHSQCQTSHPPPPSASIELFLCK